MSSVRSLMVVNPPSSFVPSADEQENGMTSLKGQTGTKRMYSYDKYELPVPYSSLGHPKKKNLVIIIYE